MRWLPRPAEIISHAVWLYHRFSWSLREVEELLARRNVEVTYRAEGVARPVRHLDVGQARDFADHVVRLAVALDAGLLDGLAKVTADDRAGLERLLRYGARPALCQRRLSLTPSGPEPDLID